MPHMVRPPELCSRKSGQLTYLRPCGAFWATCRRLVRGVQLGISANVLTGTSEPRNLVDSTPPMHDRRSNTTGGLTWPVLIPLTYILGLTLPRWPRYLLCSAEPSSSCVPQTNLRHQFPFPTFPPRGRFEAASTWASSQAGMRCSLSTNGVSY